MTQNNFNEFEVQLYKDGYEPLDVFYLFFGMLRDSLKYVDPKMKWITLGKNPPQMIDG
jgi:hypothetical protein